MPENNSSQIFYLLDVKKGTIKNEALDLRRCLNGTKKG